MGGTWQKNPAYGKAAWRRARLACLEAAAWRCQRCLPGCQGAASQVNHRQGLAADPGHTDLEAICVSCHRKVTAQQGGGFRKVTVTDPQPLPSTAWLCNARVCDGECLCTRLACICTGYPCKYTPFEQPFEKVQWGKRARADGGPGPSPRCHAWPVTLRQPNTCSKFGAWLCREGRGWLCSRGAWSCGRSGDPG